MNNPFTSPARTAQPPAPVMMAAVAQASAEPTPMTAQTQPSAPPPPRAEAPKSVPQDFVYDSEHPILPIPFKVWVGENKLEGDELSVTAAYVAIGGALDPAWKGHREVVKLQFDFQGFSVTLYPDMIVAGSRRDGEMTLQFMDPAGEHLPQLRYIMNTFLAGDFVSLGGMMGYTGPILPKPAKGSDPKSSKFRIRSLAVIVASVTMILVASNILFSRATQSYEPRPVFVERTGQDMKATTAGQVSFLNPNAKKGEVVFSINSNAGDVLNFQLPCDCEVVVTEGIYEGSTVLPIDSILSFFEPTTSVRVQTQMSIEGLSKVMTGEQAYLDLNDGRTIPVRVVLTSATNTASLRGDLFVPVRLMPPDGALTPEDIGKAGQLRLSKAWFGHSLPKSVGQP
jgi:mannuronan synthase